MGARGSDGSDRVSKESSADQLPGFVASRFNHVSENNGQLPNSKKIYVSAKLHPDIRVPFREITLAPTKSMNGEIEINEPVRVYDTSGPWGDPDFHGDVTQGLPPLRAKWIRERGDIEEISGRAASPRDDGYLSEVHRASANGHDGNSRLELGDSKFAARKPLRGRAGSAVTQLAYARRGIITPEMEFIAIRENIGRDVEPRIENRAPVSNDQRSRLQFTERSPSSPLRIATNR